MSLMPGRRWLVFVFVCLAVTIGGAEQAAAQTLTLTWDPSPDPTVVGYIVYAGTRSGQYSASFNVGAATSFTYGVVPDQQYFFAVASYDAGMIVGPVSGEAAGSARAPAVLSNSGDQSAPKDDTPPVVTITLPETSDQRLTVAHSIAVGGVAADDNGVVAVTWTNGRGGGGVATGTDAWLAGVVLNGGRNIITITAIDRAGNRGTATISIYRQTLGP